MTLSLKSILDYNRADADDEQCFLWDIISPFGVDFGLFSLSKPITCTKKYNNTIKERGKAKKHNMGILSKNLSIFAVLTYKNMQKNIATFIATF